MDSALETAKSLHNAGKLEEAAAAYRQILEQDPDSVKALNNLGNVLDDQGLPEQATECYRRALEIDSSFALIHYNLANTLHRTGHGFEAISCYLKALELDPKMVSAQYNLGLLLYQQQRLESAESVLRRAVEMAPDLALSHCRLGDVLFDTKRLPEALECYRRAVEIDPDEGEYHFHVGKSQEVMRRWDEAVQCYLRSLECEPGVAVVQRHLAHLLYQMGEHDEAVAVYEQWITTSPDDPVAMHMLSALSGQDVPSRASDQFVQRTFDASAEDFDGALARLDYQAPTLIARLLAEHVPQARKQFDILDAGCGTGLCGAMVGPYARRLVGVDLSAGMLAKARFRHVYDDLVRAELTAFLVEHSASYDVVLAADTLNYFGALEPVFASAAGALRHNGLFLFTLEHDEGEDLDWRLQMHGRYTHGENYLRKALVESDLEVITLRTDTLRKEGGQGVTGWIVAARRRATQGRTL